MACGHSTAAKGQTLGRDKVGRTPLSWAAAVVKLLLETGTVEADSRDDTGRTPLSYAAEGEHETVVKLLLETGKADDNLANEDGWTPLPWAAKEGNEDVVGLPEPNGQYLFLSLSS